MTVDPPRLVTQEELDNNVEKMKAWAKGADEELQNHANLLKFKNGHKLLLHVTVTHPEIAREVLMKTMYGASESAEDPVTFLPGLHMTSLQFAGVDGGVQIAGFLEQMKILIERRETVRDTFCPKITGDDVYMETTTREDGLCEARLKSDKRGVLAILTVDESYENAERIGNAIYQGMKQGAGT